jgi:hypothetical protein
MRLSLTAAIPGGMAERKDSSTLADRIGRREADIIPVEFDCGLW